MEGAPPSVEPIQEFLGHVHSYSKMEKRKKISRKQQFCRPIKAKYDPNRYAEFVLKLDRLKYLESRDPLRPGQYVVRVSCMGQNYGHFLSGLADMGAFVTLARTPREFISKDNCPDIDLSETLGLQILFKDLMDNPVVLTLLDGRHDCVPIKNDEDFSTLQPLGYLCLDMLELVNFEMGYTDEYCEPWVLQKEKVLKHKKFPMGEPMIQFSVSCIGGLPGEDEMNNANVMTIMVESVNSLSEELSKMDHNLKNDFNVYISLPLEDMQTSMLFTRGTYMDENFEKISKHKSKRSKSVRVKGGKFMKPMNHWASVLQYSPNIPSCATIIPEDISEKPEHTTEFSGNMHNALDDEHLKHVIASSPKIVWNSLRKKFIDPDTYQKVLEEFSKYSVWPAEVAISVKKEKEIKKKQKTATPSEHVAAVDVNNGPPTTNATKTGNKARSSITPLQRRTSLEGSSNETNGTSGSNQSPGQPTRQSPISPEGEHNVVLLPSPETSGPEVQYETTIIYHGIALFDLTQLLSPGITSVRFACQLFPYSDKLLYSKTCLRKSAFLSTIPGYVPANESKVTVSNTSFLPRKSIAPHKRSDKTHEKRKHSVVPSRFVERHSRGNTGRKSTNSQDEEEQNEFENENDLEIEKQQERHSAAPPHNKKPFAPKMSEEIDEDHQVHIDNHPVVTKSGAPVPFIVFEITMKNPIVPRYIPEDIARRIEEYIPNRNLPRRKIINAGLAQATYRRSVIQASADLCETFHSSYLEDVVNDPKNRELLDPENPASSCDALKKGFLLYLNATGRYLILREHLRHSIAHIIQQRCLTLKPNGFQTKQEFQNYLHDMYVYLVDQMHDVLSSTNMNESNPLIESQKQPPSSSSIESNDKSEVLRKLCIYAEEALAQGDLENCHRLHLQRICRNGEDPGTWVDFAVMWLARGDDRMAEIAVREALRINPQHVYALILAGVMAAKHGDKQAIDFVGSALGLQPSSPELMVILAMVYTSFKNDVASDYYFKNARYVHSAMTGSDTQNMQNEFTKLNERFEAFKNYSDAQGIEDVIQLKEKDNISWLKLNEDPRMMKVKRSSKAHIDNFQNVKVHPSEVKSVKSNTSGEVKIASSLIGPQPQARNSMRPSKVSKVPGKTARDSGASVGSPRKILSTTGKVILTLPPDTKEPIVHSARSKPQLHRRTTIVLPQQFRPKFQFDTELSEESLKMTLPPLIPSVQTSWDVTDPANIAVNESSPLKLLRKGSISPAKISSPAETIASNMTTETEAVDESDKEKFPNFQFNPDEFMAQFVQLYGEDGAPHLMVCTYGYPSEEIGCEDDDYNMENCTSRLSKSNTNSGTSTRIVSEESTKPLSEDSNKTTIEGSNNLTEGSAKSLSDSSGKPLPEVPNHLLPESAVKNLPETSVKQNKNVNENADKEMIQIPNKKYTKRIGSEYIWTAQLLLNLRLFDLMDGVLAREVHMVEMRSIPYLYLRSMSLYLRHRSAEALTYVNEALELNPTSATLWALKGHCLYRLNQHLEAIESYQKAVLLPHEKDDFHLVYLRFGCLCMDHADEGSSLHLAKKIFRRGIHLYPSPYMWLAFGNTCYHLEQFDEAEEAFAEANRIDITSPMIWGHLALVSLARNDKALAEQSYKWAVRFGLREGPMVDEIKRMHVQKGFGDPTFPRIPECIPHEYYLRRVGRELPFDIYKEALYQEPPAAMGYIYNDTDRETELKKRLDDIKEETLPIRISHSHSDIHVQVAHVDQDDENNGKDPSQEKSHKKTNKDGHSAKERDKKLKASRTYNKHENDKSKRKASHKGKSSTTDGL